MSTNSPDKKKSDSDVKKQNEDLPNIPGSTDEIKKEEPVKKQIKESSKLQKDGKTENTDKE